MPESERIYRLEIEPRILELLGPNLYTNVYYVLAELIANAFDADAKNVYIIANDQDIRVEDDGHGMSYEEGEIGQYLKVAEESRTSEDDSTTKSGERKKMGRKGVGKLAALSVSEDVDILSVAAGEKSGFVLSRHPGPEGELRAISEDEIIFQIVQDHGTAIVMRNPQYQLHKTLDAIRRNLLKIFPLVNEDFRIHIIRGKEHIVIDEFESAVVTQLSTLITLGDKFAPLIDLVQDKFPASRKDLVSAEAPWTTHLTMSDRYGAEREYTLEVVGWIGTYESTKGRKAEKTDFPDNFISLFANEKLGEFNILPLVGQNRLSEVYVVGQLHVDLLELSELPDIALSNRQGYKSDDPRYEAVTEYVRSKLLPSIIQRREAFADLASAGRKLKKLQEQLNNETRLRADMDAFRKKASDEAATALQMRGSQLPREEVSNIVAESINAHSPDLGLKTVVDSQKKKILISQTRRDKPLADAVYSMLLFNNVPAEDILYTNSDDEACRVPEGRGVYEYLREFFVESYSTQKIFVLFVTSNNTKRSWGAIAEVGAAWITQIDHKIFNIRPFRPEHPLDDEMQWQSTSLDKNGELWTDRMNADVLCVKVEAVCDELGYSKRTRGENLAYLGTIVAIREN